MEAQKLAEKLQTEIQEYPAITKNMVKMVMDTIQMEIKDGKLLLSELLESEGKVFDTLAHIIDLNINTGLFDPFDFKIIRGLVEKLLKPILIKFFGPDWLNNLRKIL